MILSKFVQFFKKKSLHFADFKQKGVISFI